MTNDKDGAALLREALGKCRDQFQFYAKEHRSKTTATRVIPFTPDEISATIRKAETNEAMVDMIDAALQSHGQAFDAAGVREACANVARNFEYKEPTHYFDDPFSAAGEMIAEEILALPIPEAPASVEPVAWALRKGNDRELGWADWGRLTDAEKADGWTETPLYAHNQRGGSGE